MRLVGGVAKVVVETTRTGIRPFDHPPQLPQPGPLVRQRKNFVEAGAQPQAIVERKIDHIEIRAAADG